MNGFKEEEFSMMQTSFLNGFYEKSELFEEIDGPRIY
jgi:hypothetical protein